jgi:RNA polymerase sigma-70 factor (ECF subfamily)
VKRFNAGDQEAFVEIYERHKNKIFVVTFGLLRDRSDAEEITQEVFIRAHRGLSAFRGESSLSTWLYRIAKNLCKNRYWYKFRRRSHLTSSLDAPMGPDSVASFADMISTNERTPGDDAVADEFSRCVDECMSRISRRSREILTLRCIKNTSYEEIAEILCLEIGTVKSRIARARDELRKTLLEAMRATSSNNRLIHLLQFESSSGSVKTL